jgi:hypothetical protein
MQDQRGDVALARRRNTIIVFEGPYPRNDAWISGATEARGRIALPIIPRGRGSNRAPVRADARSAASD